ncbi:MAG TPA: choice-of-anchor Q domain-containing protein, partial [Ktedonobacteraceae bacterium]
FGGSIVAENSGGDCSNVGILTDNGYNMDSDGSCFTASTSKHGNPQLSPLANTGGPTQTMALQQGSPAIDAVPTNVGICPSSDQRGDARPDDPSESACDMGADESTYPPPDTDLGLTNMPANITTNATSPQGATVTYTSPTATDESGDNPAPTVDCTPASGSVLPIGTTTVTCTATDSDDSNSPVSQTFTVTVNDTDLGLTNIPSNITTNATSPQGATVTYAPPTAVDEDTPLPAVNCTPASGSVLPIGTTTVTCTVNDSDDTPSTASGNFSVTVQPALKVSGTMVSATEGSAFSGVIATGTANGISSSLTASITWGDGTRSTVTVTPAPDGSYSISASHTYAEEGQETISISVSDSNGHSASTTSQASVSDAPLTLKQFVAGQVKHLVVGLGAHFTDADPAGQASDYTATITWGDGTTSKVTVYKNPLGQGFVLAGLHSYAHKGTYSVTLTVTDQGGSQLTKTGTVSVS